jgi:hypothetical protein
MSCGYSEQFAHTIEVLRRRTRHASVIITTCSETARVPESDLDLLRLALEVRTYYEWIIPTALLTAISLSPAVASTSRPQEQAKQGEELEAKISVAKPLVAADEALRLRIEIWNVGARDLLVCKEFFSSSAPCSLRLDFQPLAKVEHCGLASDCVPYEWMPQSPSPRTQDFASILIEDWVSIPPNHFYGATIELNPSSYPELRVPGHYRVSGTYFSGGLLEAHCYYKLKPFSNEVANLPVKSWHGIAYSNSVAVHVGKTKK